MIENKLIFIVPFRNCFHYIEECANSLLSQDYTNWVAYFSDDKSFDYTHTKIPKDNRFVYHRNEERLTALMNIHETIKRANPNPNDVICVLDGDDYLCRPDAMKIVNSLYQDETLLTYGQYLFPWGEVGHSKPYKDEEDFLNNLRGGFLASHLRTYKYKLYEKFLELDPNLDNFKSENGEFFSMTYDVAMMTPLMEIAGFDRIKFNEVPIYQYRLHENSDQNISRELQLKFEKEIYRKPPLSKQEIK